MAKKKKKIIPEKIKYKKPVKSCNKAEAEIIRIKRNEQSKLYRRVKKLKDLPRRGKGAKTKADALRKEIKHIDKNIWETNSSLKKVRKNCETFDSISKQKTKLKGTITRLNTKLEKLYEARDFEGHKAANKEFFKATTKLRDAEKKLNEILFNTNVELGFSYKDLGKIMTKKQLQELKDDEQLSDEDISEIISDNPALGRNYKDRVEELNEQYAEEAEEVEEPESGDWIHIMTMVVWKIWRDFDDEEINNLDNYKKVIFIDYEGHSKTFTRASKTLIAAYAKDYWKKAQEIGSDAIVSKWKTRDSENLKYIMEEL